jgi:hypothetical protein
MEKLIDKYVKMYQMASGIKERAKEEMKRLKKEKKINTIEYRDAILECRGNNDTMTLMRMVIRDLKSL